MVLVNLNLFAQGEMFGSTSSNFAGVNSIVLNPSAMHHQKTWFSFNLASANVFLHTDMLYFDKDEFQLKDVFQSNFEFFEHETGYGSEKRPFYSYDRDRNTSIDQSIRILGPSLMLSYNQHAFAISSNVRLQTNVRNLSPDLANILAYGFSYFPQYLEVFEIDKFNGTTMLWSEIGFSYAYRTKKEAYAGWSYGITIKRLLGTGGGYLNVDNSTYQLVDSQKINILNQNAELGFSGPMDFDTNAYIPNSLLTGNGWSMDIGFTYQSLIKFQPKLDAKRFCEQAIVKYKYRIGVALLDIGSVSFNENAQTHNFSNSTQTSGDMDGAELNNVNQILELMSDQFYGSPNTSFESNSAKIKLPMALSIQADYNTQVANLYWNASLIYGVPLQGGALRRPSQFTLAPRYETRLIEVSIPLSLYQFRYPHLGVYARVGPFSVGSDWLSTVIGNKDFHGYDIYFSIKFQLLKDNCRFSSYRDACIRKSSRFRWSI